MFGDLFKVKK